MSVALTSLPLAAAVAGPATPGLLAAFALGAVSFLSPCVLPLVPGYLSTITGLSLDEVQGGGRIRVLVPAALFCLSFSAIFILLGLTASSVGQVIGEHKRTLEIISGTLVALFGAAVIAMAFTDRLARSWQAGWLLQNAGVSPIVAGAAFAIAWTPCIGPTLGAILSAAAGSSTVSHGGVLLAAYSLGLAVPFLLCAMALQRVLGPMRWASRHHRAIGLVSGTILLTLGLLILTGEMAQLTARLSNALAGSWLEHFANL